MRRAAAGNGGLTRAAEDINMEEVLGRERARRPAQETPDEVAPEVEQTYWSSSFGRCLSRPFETTKCGALAP